MANENGNSLFRKSGSETVDSPEKLNEYLRVTEPGIWALLASIIVILIGAVVWGIFARIDTYVPAAVVVENGEAACLVPESALEAVIHDRTIEVDGRELTLSTDTYVPVIITEDANIYVMLAGELSVGDVVYEVPITDSMEDGVYSGQIKTESLSPISLLFN